MVVVILGLVFCLPHSFRGDRGAESITENS